MGYAVEGVRPTGRPKKIWSEVVKKDSVLTTTSGQSNLT